MKARHCICRPYHKLWCPEYGEDNRNLEHAYDCPCTDCEIERIREARSELAAESKVQS